MTSGAHYKPGGITFADLVAHAEKYALLDERYEHRGDVAGAERRPVTG